MSQLSNVTKKLIAKLQLTEEKYNELRAKLRGLSPLEQIEVLNTYRNNGKPKPVARNTTITFSNGRKFTCKMTKPLSEITSVADMIEAIMDVDKVNVPAEMLEFGKAVHKQSVSVDGVGGAMLYETEQND